MCATEKLGHRLNTRSKGYGKLAALPLSIAIFSDATSFKTSRRDFLERLCKQANEVVKVEARPGDELSFTREKAAPLLSI